MWINLFRLGVVGRRLALQKEPQKELDIKKKLTKNESNKSVKNI